MAKPSILAKAAPETKRQAAIASEPGRSPLVGAAFELGAASADQFPASGAREIAFAGRSNAGKSSAINALARRRGLARASRTPGRTREINFYRLRDGSRIADLPGYGYAAVPAPLKRRWQDLLSAYVSTRIQLVGLVLVVDVRHGLREPDRALLDGFLPSCRPVLILATKADKLAPGAARSAAAAILAQARTDYAAHADRIDGVAFSAAAAFGLGVADSVIEQWIA